LHVQLPRKEVQPFCLLLFDLCFFPFGLLNVCQTFKSLSLTSLRQNRYFGGSSTVTVWCGGKFCREIVTTLIPTKACTLMRFVATIISWCRS
jgi:hypothetical protein